ncbi:MAG: VOC family protein [Candidatus Binataceae bacterium]
MELPLKVAELDHVVLRCANQARMLEFYTCVLGLHEERRLAHMGLVQLRAGASMLDLVPASAPRAPDAGNVDHFCLGIEAADMNEVANYLRDRGADVIGEPAQRYGARGMGLSVYTHDPEGNVVELKQMPSFRSRGNP